MNNLKIITVENGFIVCEQFHQNNPAVGKQWVFQTAQELAEYIHQWATDIITPEN